MSKIAVLLGPDFEDQQFKVPYDHLYQARHDVVVLGSTLGDTLHGRHRRVIASVQNTADHVQPNDFAILLIPGGYSPDHLRTDHAIVDFVSQFATLHRPIAAIGHGPQLLIEAEVVAGKKLTSFPSIKRDLLNAGAVWLDQAVCIDGELITARDVDGLDAFSSALLKRIGRSVSLGLDDTWRQPVN